MFTGKGCTEMARLVGEVEDLRKIMVTGQGLEEKEEKQGIKRQHWKKRRRRKIRNA